MRAFTTAALLVLASCQPFGDSDGCNGVIGCLSSSHGIVLGPDAAARLAASRELRSAAAAYSTWFDGKVPVRGLVILDTSAARNTRFVGERAWTLNYFRSGNSRRVEDGGVATPPPGEAGRDTANAPFAISETSAEFDVARPGVLAHEICHRHASHAFNQAWGSRRTFPDMLDEVAAISCESKSMKDERVRQFAQSFTKGNFIPWQAFLGTKHPLKDSKTIKAMSQLSSPGTGTVTFDIRSSSAYGSKLAIFYSQAAAFGAFVDARSCRGMQALGRLLSAYDPRRGLDHWLRVNGARFCLPSSLDAFESAFSQYVEELGPRPGLPA